MVLTRHLVREKFTILVDKIYVEDDSGIEVDETVFADLATQNGICFIIQDGDNNGKLTKKLYIPWMDRAVKLKIGHSFLAAVCRLF